MYLIIVVFKIPYVGLGRCSPNYGFCDYFSGMIKAGNHSSAESSGVFYGE